LERGGLAIQEEKRFKWGGEKMAIPRKGKRAGEEPKEARR